MSTATMERTEQRETATAYKVGDVVWFTVYDAAGNPRPRPARGVVAGTRTGRPRVSLPDGSTDTVDPARIVEAPAAPEVGDTVWYRDAEGRRAAAVMQGVDDRGWYVLAQGNGLTVPVNPGLLVDAPDAVGTTQEEQFPEVAAGDGASETDPVQSSEPAAEPGPLKALSLWQPWASLIAVGAKRIETRGKATSHRGPIAIHAAKTTEHTHLAEKSGPINTALEAAGLVRVVPEDGERVANLPFGAVVAVADLIDCVEFTEGYDPGEPEAHFGDFTPGRFGYVLENVRPLRESVPTGGKQYMWDLPADVAAAVREQLVAPEAGDPDPVAVQQFETDGGKPAADPGAEAPAAAAPVEPPTPPAVATAAVPADEPPVPSPDVWQSILEARRKEASAAAHVESLKVELAEAKKVLEKASDHLGKLIDDAKYPTLFSARHSTILSQPVVMPTAQMVSVPPPEAAPAAEPAPDPEAWRSVPVGEVVKDAKVAALLADAGYATFGQLEDLRAKRWEPKVAGLGPKKQQAIEDDVVAWWAARPAEKAAAGKAAGLEWEENGGPASYVAANTAGITEGEDDDRRPAEFVLDSGTDADGPYWTVDLSSDLLMPVVLPHSFPTVEEAKAWCQRRNDELAADPDKGQPTAEPEPTWLDAEPKSVAVTVVEHKAKGLFATLVVQLRGDGAWGHKWMSQDGQSSQATPLRGPFATRAEAAHAGAVEVRKWWTGRHNPVADRFAPEAVDAALAGLPAEGGAEPDDADPADPLEDLGGIEAVTMAGLDAMADDDGPADEEPASEAPDADEPF